MRVKNPAIQTLHIVLLTAALNGCAVTTPYSQFHATELTDEQLVEELLSCAEGLGIELNRTMYLMAVRPEPAYVLTSSTSTFVGSMGVSYSTFSMPLGYGIHSTSSGRATITGTSITRYEYTDVNALARLGNDLATAISQSRAEAYRRRGLEVLHEYEQRAEARRRHTESLIDQFFAENPELQSRKMLVAAVTPWAAAENSSDPLETLQRAKRMIDALSRGNGLTGTWYGTFAQTTTLNSGELFAVSEFVRIDLHEDGDGHVRGRGTLGTGEVIELTGTRSEYRLEAAVANITSGINVTLTAILAENQMTAEFSGFGAGQRLTGTALLLR